MVCIEIVKESFAASKSDRLLFKYMSEVRNVSTAARVYDLWLDQTVVMPAKTCAHTASYHAAVSLCRINKECIPFNACAASLDLRQESNPIHSMVA